MKGLTTIALAFGITFVLSFIVLSPASEATPGDFCTDNLQCDVNEICESGRCSLQAPAGTPPTPPVTPTPTGSTCDPACDITKGKGCVGGRCINIFVPTISGQCRSDTDCGTGWTCHAQWKVCYKPNEYREQTTFGSGRLEVTVDQDDYCRRGESAAACVSRFYSSIGRSATESATDTLPLIGTYVNDADRAACILDVSMTAAAVDDDGRWCAGTDCFLSSGFGNVAGLPRNFASNFIAAGTDQLTVTVTDTGLPADRGSTRGIQSNWAISVLKPTPAQKCVYNTTTRTTQLAPLCPGTKESCTQKTGSSFSCVDCGTLNGWKQQGVGVPTCEGAYSVQQRNEVFMTYTSCDTLAKDPAVGSYATCTGSATQTRQLPVSRTLCKYGCSGGSCKESASPALTSIRLLPDKISVTGNISVTSAASDPDMLSDGTTTRREKITLECSTAEGTVEEKGGTCSGTRAPNMINVVRDVNNRNPGLIARDCRAFTQAVACELWRMDPRFGLNAKRGNFNDPSEDAISYTGTNGAGGVDVIDIVGGCNSPGASPAWQDVTQCGAGAALGGWIQPPCNGIPITGAVTGTLPITGFATLPAPAGSGEWVPNLCKGDPAERDPKCTITIPQGMITKSLNGTVFCRVRDESGRYSEAKSRDVFIDASPPTSIITSPDAGSEQTANFNVVVTDADDDGLDKCFFYTTSAANATSRNCNSAFSVRIGPGGNCPNHGTCDVFVYATDKSGNRGDAYRRSFQVSLVSANITLPQAGAFMTDNFNVTVRDRNIFRANTTPVVCTYEVFSLSNSSSNRTASGNRPCNSVFNVTVGPEGDCRTNGDAACKVVARISTTSGGITISATSERFYGIDWFSPKSSITAFPAGWVTGNFVLSVADEAQGSVLNACQYRVVSNGTQTVPWTDRACNTTLAISVSRGGNCRHDGASCIVYVRPLGRNNLPGLNDSKLFAIMIDGNVTSTNGFSANVPTTTNRGINFSGTLATTLALSTFYVCNTGSSPSACISSYNSLGSGINSASFCGALFSGSSGRCELRCNDREISYYLLAKGQTTSGPLKTVYVVSPITTGTCPTFNIGEIEEFLRVFNTLEQEITIQIMMTAQSISQFGETASANSETISRLTQALLLTTDHLDFMTKSIPNLDTTSAAQLISRSNIKISEINSVLLGITTPTIIQMSVDMAPIIRFGGTAALTANVTRIGTDPAFGRVYCSITKPGFGIITNASSCAPLPGLSAVQFQADRVGQWFYTCTLGRSMRNDCSLEFNGTPVSGSFQVMPSIPSTVNALDGDTSVVKGESATINAVVDNPDVLDKFGAVGCDFADPSGVIYKNFSGCFAIPAGGSGTGSLQIAGSRLGDWTARRCAFHASSSSLCTGLQRENISSLEWKFAVTTPGDLFIDSVTVPSSVINDTSSRVLVVAQNPTTAAAYAQVDCSIATPTGSTTLTGRSGIDSGMVHTFALDLRPQVTGLWTVTNCTASKSLLPDYSALAQTYSVSQLGSFNVIPGTNLTIIFFNASGNVVVGNPAQLSFTVRNPLATRFGQIVCNYRNPANAQLTARSQCSLAPSGSEIEFSVSIPTDRTGTFSIDSCSVVGSVNTNCSGSVIHGTVQPVGQFSSLTTLPTASNLRISNILTVPATRTGVAANTTIIATNNEATDTYAFAGCTFTNPSGSSTRQVSACKQVLSGSSGVFSVSNMFNIAGTWNITGCYLNSSQSSICSGSLQSDSSPTASSVSVSAPTDLYIGGLDVPDEVVNNTNTQITLTARNPTGTTRFATAACAVADPSGATQSISSACTAVTANAQITMPLSVNRAGIWILANCTLFSSNSTTCASSQRSDEMLNGDAFHSTRGFRLQIASAGAQSPVYVGAQGSVIYTIRNPSAATFARVSCSASRGGVTVTSNSGCMQLSSGDTSSSARMTFSSSGTWALTCSVERSSQQNCAAAVTDDTRTSVFDVLGTPSTVYVKTVNAADGDIANNSEVRIDATIENPTNDDRFSALTCVIRNPFNVTQTRNAACQPVPATTAANYNVSVFANIAGGWTVTECSALPSTFADCSGASPTGTLRNGDTFNVVRGYNVIISTMQILNSYGGKVNVSVSVNNPSDAQRFARVTCSATGNGLNVTNSTSCFPMNANQIITQTMRVDTGTLGTFNLACSASRSFSADCSAATTDDTKTTSFTSTEAPNLFIQSVTAPATTPKDRRMEATVTVRNPGLLPLYAYAGCTFKNFLNETRVNTSLCQDASRDTTNMAIGFIPDYRGLWNITGCFVRASSSPSCDPSTLHNVSTESDAFSTTSPILSIERVVLSSSQLNLNDLLDIAVDVRNNDETDHNGFVNCSVVNPRGTRFMLTSPLQSIQFGETLTFHPQKRVDIAGAWKLEYCSVFRVNSPPVLDDQYTFTQSESTVTVTPTAPLESCSSNLPCRSGFACVNNICVAQQQTCSLATCPGTDNACYCLGDSCISCPSGTTCISNRCVTTTEIPATCRVNSDCVSGKVCLNGLCVDQGGCILNADCADGLVCTNGRCTVPPSEAPQGVINLLIIVLAAISVPIILFVYIKRAI